MTQEQIIAGNIIIAEFMGYTSLSDEFKIPQHERMIAFNSIKNQEFFWSDRFKHTELCFHTSWDWLMPVVRKCLEICNDLMLNEWEGGFSDAFLSCEINILHKEVVDFIKWYNSNNHES